MKNNKNGGNVRTVDPKKYLADRRKNKAYWGERAKQRNTRMVDEAEATARELKKGYAAAETLIEQEVRKIYRGFENAFSLSHAEAKRLINQAKSETPSKALLDSINRIADPDKRRQMQALVSAPAYKWRIDRLDKVQKQAKELSARLYNAELRTDLRFLASQMDEAYKHTIFDIQQGTGGSGAFEVLPESRIKQVLNTKWRGEHFSSRIWGNTQNLVTELRQNMLESFLTGEGEREAVARIQERFGVTESKARRLIRTESTYVCGQAELEGYRNSAVERYEYASLDDNRRSKVCERLDGKTFPVSKAKPGINYPPMHPFCRSSTLPVLPDEEDLDKEWDGFIAEYVPEDLTFEEWLDGLEPTEDGKLVFKQKSVDISVESGIIKAGHNLAERRRFNFEDYPIVDNPESVRQAQDYASENLGINNIRGFEKLTDGYTMLQIFQRLKTLKSEYKKSYSSVSVFDYGDERTIAETVINELRLNSRFMNSPAAVKAILDGWVETGFIPKGCNNIDYVANHEFFHLLTQDLIDEPHSRIVTEVKRALNNNCEIISENGRYNIHEFVADLISAHTLTPKQQTLKNKILKQLN